MRILVTSDTHDRIFSFREKVDAVLHCGDLTNFGMKDHKTFEILCYMERIANTYPFYWVPGNHDWGFENLSPLYGHNVHRQLNRLGEYTLLGMSYSPAYNDPYLAEKWCNMCVDREKEFAYYDSLPYADIIISHCPPTNCGELDTCPFSNEKNLGSQGLFEYILREQPKYVFCGHIHQKKVLKYQLGNTNIINVATRELYINI